MKKTYEIEVRAHGYETITVKVLAVSRLAANKRFAYHAVNKWLEHNDLDSDARGLAFTYIRRLK